MTDSLVMRGKTWQMRRAVPVRYHRVEHRREVMTSLKTDSRREALRRADEFWTRQVSRWELMLGGNDPGDKASFDAAQKIAAFKGFVYVGMEELLNGPLQSLLDRIEAITISKDTFDQAEASALLGTVPKPVVKLSNCLDLFWKYSVEDRKGKSDDQVRRWRNPIKKAMKNLIAVVGDKPIDQLSRDDMLDFRDWWEQRLDAEDLTANSANKDLMHVGKVLKRINTRQRLNLDLPLGGLSFAEDEQRKRPSSSDDWIKTRILAPGALDGLNGEARAILHVMVNTGARPSEIAGLKPEHIKLDDAVPHICIRGEGRTLKSRRAKRDLPLTGTSLDAMRGFQQGFPRYQESSASLSATVNKHLRAKGLMETEEHTMYSLRHSMMDRMIVNGVDDRIRRDVFGHRLETEEYGNGGGLAHTAGLLGEFAL